MQDGNGTHAQEALRSVKIKFLGGQKIIVSRKWGGFTEFGRGMIMSGGSSRIGLCRIMPDGVNAVIAECYDS